MPMTPLIDFYLGKSRDHRGRTIAEIWSMDRRELEQTHDYIQWLFPAWIPSLFSPEAPVLDEETRAAFLEDPELRLRLLESLDVMLDFYGLVRDADEIRSASGFDGRATCWLTAGNHNHLRITRMLGALWTLGCEAESTRLHHCLESIADDFPDRVTAETKQCWAEAARRLPA